MNVVEDVFVWVAWVLIFILSKSEGFQSGTLPKMPTSSLSMEEFCRGTQK